MYIGPYGEREPNGGLCAVQRGPSLVSGSPPPLKLNIFLCFIYG